MNISLIRSKAIAATASLTLAGGAAFLLGATPAQADTGLIIITQYSSSGALLQTNPYVPVASHAECVVITLNPATSITEIDNDADQPLPVYTASNGATTCTGPEFADIPALDLQGLAVQGLQTSFTIDIPSGL
jgi:hypothetical protein